MKSFKRFVPNFVKFPLWYAFKAPQRKFGMYTLILDLTGIVRYLFCNIFKIYPLEPISICVGIKNRSELFLNHFIHSLNQCTNLDLIELSVFDCGSSDMNDIGSALEEKFNGKLVFQKMQMDFARSFSFNRAVEQSTHEKIFLCDADFSIPKNIVDLVNRYTFKNSVWFPIVFYLYKNKPEKYDKPNGEWMQHGGKGLLACNKSDFVSVGKLNENYTSWGYEDEDLWLRFYEHKKVVIRTREKGLLHHWHPSLNPKYKKLEEMADNGLL